jgi:hypothetical protein
MSSAGLKVQFVVQQVTESRLIGQGTDIRDEEISSIEIVTFSGGKIAGLAAGIAGGLLLLQRTQLTPPRLPPSFTIKPYVHSGHFTEIKPG